jgi:hypothetical protein
MLNQEVAPVRNKITDKSSKRKVRDPNPNKDNIPFTILLTVAENFNNCISRK